MTEILSDEILAGKIKCGDHQALAEIIKRYQGKLFYYILKISNNHDEAEDIVQETFLKAYKNIQSFDEGRKFSSWIYRIAHNHAINHIKKRSKTQATELQILDWLADHEDEVNKFLIQEEKEDNKEILDNLSSCLDLIRPEYKQVIVLYYYENKSYDEISEILRIPESTVGVWLKRGREKMKKIIDQKYDRRK